MRTSLQQWLTYLKLQWKRVAAVLPVSAGVSLLVLIVVGLAGAAFFQTDAEDEAKQIIPVGIVGSYEDSFLRLAVNALKNLDSSRFSVDFTMMEEEEARESLRRGTISAYVIIPEGLYESIDSYRNDVQITYVSTQGAVSIGTLMIDEVAETIGDLLLESENAVYGMQRFLSDHNDPSDRVSPSVQNDLFDHSGLSGQNGSSPQGGAADGGDDTEENAAEKVYTAGEIAALGNAMTEEYAAVILRRSGLFSVSETGLSGHLSFRGYFLCAMLTLFLLLLSIPFSTLFIRRDPSLHRMLSLNGLPYAAQLAAEYLVYMLTILIMMGLVLPLVGFVLAKTGIDIPELSGTLHKTGAAGQTPGVLYRETGVAGVIRVLCFSLIPAVCVVSSFQFLLYELFRQAVPAILMQVSSAILTGYMAGCFYPVSYFPDVLQIIGNLLPAGCGRLLLEAGLTGSAGFGEMVRGAIYTAICLGCALLIRYRRHFRV